MQRKLTLQQQLAIDGYCRIFGAIYHIPEVIQKTGELLVCFEHIISGKRKFYRLDDNGNMKPYKFKGGVND